MGDMDGCRDECPSRSPNVVVVTVDMNVHVKYKLMTKHKYQS